MVGVDSNPLGPEPDEAAIAANLVRRIAARDASAEGELVERYGRGILYLLRHLGAASDLAEDLQQETFRITYNATKKQLECYIQAGQHRGPGDTPIWTAQEGGGPGPEGGQGSASSGPAKG